MKPKYLIPGIPTLEEIDALFRALTGREPTAEDNAEAESLYAEYLAAAPKTKSKRDARHPKSGPERGP